MMPVNIRPAIAALAIAAGVMSAQSPSTRPAFEAFEVATIKPTAPDWKGGRFIRMQGAQFVARNHALNTLLAAAYNLTPRSDLGRAGVDRFRPLRYSCQTAGRCPPHP